MKEAYNQEIKTLFELQVLKKLIEDNFFPYITDPLQNYTATELLERVIGIAIVQNYTDFGTVYRTQLLNAISELMITHKDVSRRLQALVDKYPEARFDPDGPVCYQYYRDGIAGTTLKVIGEVSGKVAGLDPLKSIIINATTFLVDKFNYNYRQTSLDKWEPENNLVVWRDIIAGNPFLNFILTLSRSVSTPMRVVISTSTREMIKPMPTPFPPAPGPMPPSPYPPMPGPMPAPYPPMPGPYPTPPGPGWWPPPSPPPPPESHLVRDVLAERTVGGIKEGDIMPRGLTFTQFVEWLFHGKEETPEEDPSGRLTLATATRTLTYRITDLGTATPFAISFHTVQNGTLSDPIGELEYVDKDTLYTITIEQPTVTTVYRAVLHYRKSDGSEAEIRSNDQTWTIVQLDYVFYGEVSPNEIPEEIDGMRHKEISNSLLSSNSGVALEFTAYRQDMFIAIPVVNGDPYGSVVFYAEDGATPAPPHSGPTIKEYNGQNYRIYKYNNIKRSMSIILKK